MSMGDAALEGLEARNLDALVVYSVGTLSVLRPSFLHYFSGVRPLGPHSAAVLGRDGHTTLLVEPAWDVGRVAGRTWIPEIVATSKFAADLPALLAKRGITGRVGVAGAEEMVEEVYAALEASAELVRADDLIQDIASTKTPAELEHIREVARIADEGSRVFVEAARPGVSECELVAEMEHTMLKAGGEDNFTLISSGPHNHEMHEPTDRVLQKGDIVIGEISPVVEGQFIQLCRTVVLGTPSPAVLREYAMLLGAFNEAVAKVRSGTPAAELSKTMNRVISEAGYAEFCHPPYMRARGHGFGVGSIAPGGVIDDNTKGPLLEHQVVVVHPNQYLEETGYLACGETVLVTADGCERLANSETRLYQVEV